MKYLRLIKVALVFSVTCVSIEAQETMTLSMCLKELSKVYDMPISFNQNQTDHCIVEKVSKSKILEETLRVVLAKTDFKFRLVNNKYVYVYYQPHIVSAELLDFAVDERVKLPSWHQDIMCNNPIKLSVSKQSIQPIQPIYSIQTDSAIAFPIKKNRGVLKSNLLYGISTFTPNLGFEFVVGKNKTISLLVGHNPWNRKGKSNNNKKFVHWLVKPEFRVWQSNPFQKGFVGLHLFSSYYNISGHTIPLVFKRDFRYQGIALGGGVSYGYNWILRNLIGIELTIGAGGLWLNYDQFKCVKCGDKLQTKNKFYVGPTQLGLNLIYLLK